MDKIHTGGRIFDLITGDFIKGDVAICRQTIVVIAASYAGKAVVDGTNLTLITGFIDTHLHIKSILLKPFELDRFVAPRGYYRNVWSPRTRKLHRI